LPGSVPHSLSCAPHPETGEAAGYFCGWPYPRGRPARYQR